MPCSRAFVGQDGLHLSIWDEWLGIMRIAGPYKLLRQVYAPNGSDDGVDNRHCQDLFRDFSEQVISGQSRCPEFASPCEHREGRYKARYGCAMGVVGRSTEYHTSCSHTG